TQITTRRLALANGSDPIGGGFAGSFILHGIVAAALVGWAFYSHSNENWGDSSATASAIQATMVNSIPLPPKQPTNADNVLATENPSPAPTPPAPKAVEVPKPEAIPVPVLHPKPAKPAEKPAPAPPQHPQPV